MTRVFLGKKMKKAYNFQEFLVRLELRDFIEVNNLRKSKSFNKQSFDFY